MAWVRREKTMPFGLNGEHSQQEFAGLGAAQAKREIEESEDLYFS